MDTVKIRAKINGKDREFKNTQENGKNTLAFFADGKNV